MDQGAPASVRIVEELAAADGVDPEAFEPRLYDVVDPDALDALLGSTNDDAAVTVEFEVGHRSVRIDDAGNVRVAEPAGDR